MTFDHGSPLVPYRDSTLLGNLSAQQALADFYPDHFQT
jgi:hypothetical protein